MQSSLASLAFGVVGAFVAVATDSLGGAVGGFLFGVLVAQVRALRQRVSHLEDRIQDLATRPIREAIPRPSPPSVHDDLASRPVPAVPPLVVPPVPTPSEALPAISAEADGLAIPGAVDQRVDAGPLPLSELDWPQPTGAAAHSDPTGVAAAIRSLVDFCTTGNVVAKVGVVILFFGVAFLLRFAADQGLLPIEYRLMGVTASALVLLAVGWRLRNSRPDFAVAVQGGAVGILYLTIFAAFRLYALVPALAAFALMLAVVVLSGALAVIQNQSVLAVLGTTGGFLAPILASTGSGSHVSLFSYYLVLNAGVVGLAWFRAWRVLNWLGFVFTFGIGLFWGGQYYQPEFFRSTEPFLIAFFLLYVTVAVLFARRQPAQLRGYIDGSLVFGLPAIAFTMQSVLVEDIPFGRAYSAVAVSALYVGLARVLWRLEAAQRPLAEAFLALGVVFLTLAIPLAFDGHAAAAGWALEGAALVWVGFRQNRLLARTVGSMLVIGAGLAFFLMAGATVGAVPILNSHFLGGVAVAAGGMMAAYQYFRAADTRQPWEVPIEWALLAWGLLWWVGAIVMEIDRFAPGRVAVATFALGLAATSVALALLARRHEWPALRLATAPVLPVIVMLVFAASQDADQLGPWANLGWAAWPVSIAASYALLWWFESSWPQDLVRAWHALTAWLLVFLATWTAVAAVRQVLPEFSTWWGALWIAVPAAAVLGLLNDGHRPAWPVGRFVSFFVTVVPALPVVAVLFLVLLGVGMEGDPAPLPYVPVLNPLEIVQGFGLLAAYRWWRRVGSAAVSEAVVNAQVRQAGRFAIALLWFLVMNAIVGRIVHFYLDVPFDADSLGESTLFQAGVSVLWAVTASGLMAVARRRSERGLWIVGASLLGALVLKLFVIDLGDVGGIARIVSFLVTGLLILAVGYFSPAPPKQKDVA